MNDSGDALAELDSAGLAGWRKQVSPLVRARLDPAAHGDLARWSAAISRLAAVRDDPAAVRDALLELSPWRKGPFDLGGVHVDSEWRSDLKWNRLAAAIAPLEGRLVLDVGCGNGWYALRIRAAGARFVLGIDPTLLYLMQFRAVAQFVDTQGVRLLPLRLQEVPSPSRAFDTTFSMGVLYHQRSPLEHLRELRETLRPGGQLVLETLILPGNAARAVTPPDRYARMKNVWLLPSLAELRTWLERSRFRDLTVVDESVTTTAEQRRTDWMTFESLAEGLDPADPSRTVEGWPAPRRVVMTAVAPA